MLVQYQDSLKKEEYRQSLNNVQAQYETQKKIAENLELKKNVLETNLINVQQQRWLILLTAALLLSVVSVWYVYKLIKSRFKNRLAREQLNEQKRISLAVMDAQENERRHISADLHDGVGQMLSAATIQLNQQGLPGQRKLQELLDKAYTELRYLSHQITPEIVLQHGLENAIRETIGNLNDVGKQPHFTLYTHIEQPLHHTIAALCLYRCFQECCTNVIKHAKATQVAVHLNATEETVELMMEDNGIGFNKAALPNGLGLQNIRNRIAVFNGALIADSLPGKGTTIIIHIHYSFFENNSSIDAR